MGTSNAIGERRQAAEQNAQSHCGRAKEKECDPTGSRVRGLGADEDAVDVAVWQLWLNVAGLVGLAYTVWYAKRAWSEAKRSADVSQAGLDDARADVAEQERRFEAQLRIAHENLKIAQRSAAEVDRAWLSVEIIPVGGLRIEDEMVSIEARVIVKNVGKGPAIGVESTGELTLNPSELDREIRGNPGLRILSGRFGEIMFPGKEIVWEGPFSINRSAVVDAISEDLASSEPIGVYPTIVTGVRYSLPGDDTRRMTYIYLSLAKRVGAKASFDDGDTSLDLADLTWRSDVLTGPVT
ncbi:MAG: hypothetical protein V4597_19455 [Pseudomonadota bacterium]